MTLLYAEEGEPEKRQFEVAAREKDKPGGVRWVVPADSPLEAIANVLAQTGTISEGSPQQQLRQLGQDLLEMASVTGMPQHYFVTDARIARACAAMGLTISQGWEWVSRI